MTKAAQAEVRLLTAGKIAAALGVPLYRVEHVIKKRGIEPAARSGGARVFDRQALAMIRHALNAIDARQCSKRAPRDKVRLMTMGQVAAELGAPVHRCEYIVESRGIEAMGWSGHARVFNRQAVAMIRQCLNAIDAKRSCRPGEPDPSAPTLFDARDGEDG